MLRTALLLSNTLAGLAAAAHAAEKSSLVFTSQLQTGLFKPNDKSITANPHVYRPEEFAVNDLVYEGLTAWDNTSPGADGVLGTDDDFVVGSLAASWTTNYATVQSDPSIPYEITFKLRPGVTFHDGEPWNAAAAAINFDHILGSAAKKRAGFHDWYGLPLAINSWTAVSELEFKVTFGYFYAAALRELSQIRPFRFLSPQALPDIGAGNLSCTETFKKWGKPDDPDGKVYTCVGIKSPIGTGPYKLVAKRLEKADGSSRLLLAEDFLAMCSHNTNAVDGSRWLKCKYEAGEMVSEFLFEKFDSYTPTAAIAASPTFEHLTMRAYESHAAVKAALLDGSLHLALGLSTLSPSGFVSLQAREDGLLDTHVATHDLNTRYIGLHSGGALSSAPLRKMAFCIMDRTMLYEGDLAEEQPMDTLFDPDLPYMRQALPSLASIDSLCKSSSLNSSAVPKEAQPLRFLYPTGQAHIKAIVYIMIGLFAAADVAVKPMPLPKDEYNKELGKWAGDDGAWVYYDDNNTPKGQGKVVTYDLAYSESWGPGYDALTSLNDIGYAYPAEVWSDVTNYMNSITKQALNAKIRGIARIVDEDARHANFTEVMMALNEEAVFLPLTAKRNTAVTSSALAGFKFSGLEFGTGSVLTALYPAPNADEAWKETARANGWVPCPDKQKRASHRRMQEAGGLLFSRDDSRDEDD